MGERRSKDLTNIFPPNNVNHEEEGGSATSNDIFSI